MGPNKRGETPTARQIDPYGYLTDVLHHVGQHPASRVDELTRRRCKERFADQPLCSALHCLRS